MAYYMVRFLMRFFQNIIALLLRAYALRSGK